MRKLLLGKESKADLSTMDVSFNEYAQKHRSEYIENYWKNGSTIPMFEGDDPEEDEAFNQQISGRKQK